MGDASDVMDADYYSGATPPPYHPEPVPAPPSAAPPVTTRSVGSSTALPPDPRPQRRNRLRVFAPVFVVAAVAVVVVVGAASRGTGVAGKQEAKQACEREMVRNGARYGAQADDFEWSSLANTTVTGDDDAMSVEGWVSARAQGATLEQDYLCDVEFDEALDVWTVTALSQAS